MVPFRLLEFPNEILLTVCSYLKEEKIELVHLSSTCKLLRELIGKSRGLWNDLFVTATADDYLTELAMSYGRAGGYVQELYDRKFVLAWLCQLDELPLLRHAYGNWSFYLTGEKEWNDFLRIAISNKSIAAIEILIGQRPLGYCIAIPIIAFYFRQIILPQSEISETETGTFLTLLCRLVALTPDPVFTWQSKPYER